MYIQCHCRELWRFAEAVIFPREMAKEECGDLRRRRIRAKTAQKNKCQTPSAKSPPPTVTARRGRPRRPDPGGGGSPRRLLLSLLIGFVSSLLLSLLLSVTIITIITMSCYRRRKASKTPRTSSGVASPSPWSGEKRWTRFMGREPLSVCFCCWAFGVRIG